MRDKPTELGNRLLELRTALKLSRAKFGEPIGAHPTRVQDMERGRQRITLDVLAKIQDTYAPNPEWLTKGQGSMFLGHSVGEPTAEEGKKWLSDAKAAVANPAAQQRARTLLDRYKIAGNKVAELVELAGINPNPLLHEALKVLAMEGAKPESLMMLLRGISEQLEPKIKGQDR